MSILGEELGFEMARQQGQGLLAKSMDLFKYFNNWYNPTKVSPTSRLKKEARIVCSDSVQPSSYEVLKCYPVPALCRAEQDE